jgi:hypothetical protein
VGATTAVGVQPRVAHSFLSSVTLLGELDSDVSEQEVLEYISSNTSVV